MYFMHPYIGFYNRNGFIFEAEPGNTTGNKLDSC